MWDWAFWNMITEWLSPRSGVVLPAILVYEVWSTCQWRCSCYCCFPEFCSLDTNSLEFPVLPLSPSFTSRFQEAAVSIKHLYSCFIFRAVFRSETGRSSKPSAWGRELPMSVCNFFYFPRSLSSTTGSAELYTSDSKMFNSTEIFLWRKQTLCELLYNDWMVQRK